MADTLALKHVYDTVVARFAAESIDAEFQFGWRESARQLRNPRRLVWIPGDPNGQLGALLAPKGPGQLPDRPLATLAELFTIEITAHDPSSPTDEVLQWQAVRFLYDDLWRVLLTRFYGVVQQRSAKWLIDVKEARHVATLQVICAIQSKIPDSQQTTAPVDTSAELDSHELDVTDTVTAEAG